MAPSVAANPGTRMQETRLQTLPSATPVSQISFKLRTTFTVSVMTVQLPRAIAVWQTRSVTHWPTSIVNPHTRQHPCRRILTPRLENLRQVPLCLRPGPRHWSQRSRQLRTLLSSRHLVLQLSRLSYRLRCPARHQHRILLANRRFNQLLSRLRCIRPMRRQRNQPSHRHRPQLRIQVPARLSHQLIGQARLPL